MLLLGLLPLLCPLTLVLGLSSLVLCSSLLFFLPCVLFVLSRLRYGFVVCRFTGLMPFYLILSYTYHHHHHYMAFPVIFRSKLYEQCSNPLDNKGGGA